MAMERENRPARGAGKRRKKVCQFCVDKCECIDYKDAAKLRRFISERSKILPRRTTGRPSAMRPSDCSVAHTRSFFSSTCWRRSGKRQREWGPNTRSTWR